MSKTIKCDICNRCHPMVNIERKRRNNWWQFHYDSQGGSWEKLDICDDCWDGWKSYMLNKLTLYK
jgi:hypothetical protein